MREKVVGKAFQDFWNLLASETSWALFWLVLCLVFNLLKAFGSHQLEH